MQKPYLLLGLRIADGGDQTALEGVKTAVEGALPANTAMELKIPDIFAVQLTAPDDLSVFKKVAKVLDKQDGDLNGDLQWFVQLVAGDGALACN